MNKIKVFELWEVRKECIILDVRSPGEFTKGQIPGAFNLPVFSDEERVRVGTLYKRRSREVAFLEGLDFIAPKLRFFVEEAKRLAPHKKILIHCWRGGLRSQSMAVLLEAAGFSCRILEGGYKAYRTYCREELLDKDASFILVGGKTGSGKTVILHELIHLQEQVIDLEGLANHKGSVFGMLGQEQQPTQEQFENNLYECFSNFDAKKRIWIESENQSIGHAFIPHEVFKTFRDSPIFVIERPLKHRINRLVNDYGQFRKRDLINAFKKIEQRLGGQHLKAALEAIEVGDAERACTIALSYYDKAYSRSTMNNGFTVSTSINTAKMTDRQVAQKLILIATKNGL